MDTWLVQGNFLIKQINKQTNKKTNQLAKSLPFPVPPFQLLGTGVSEMATAPFWTGTTRADSDARTEGNSQSRIQ